MTRGASLVASSQRSADNRSVKHLLLLVILAGSIACHPSRPANSLFVSTDCLELEHYGVRADGSEAVIGDIIIRCDDESCPAVKRLEVWLFEDGDGDAEPSESETLHYVHEEYVDHTRGAKYFETKHELKRDVSELRYRIRGTNARGDSIESTGLAHE